MPLKQIIHFIFRTWIKITTYFFFEKVIVNGEENIPKEGPVILASNHPSSFLDPLLITAYYNRPIYYMARGDVFATKLASFLLGFLNIIPIYRKEEGAENFPKNENTFAFCINAFKKDGTVLIFSEGLSENQWELRPLRKGTARLAYDAWHNNNIGKDLKVLPVSINYSSWLQINCVAHLTFVKTIEKNHFPEDVEQGLFHRKFNDTLKDVLEQNSVIIDKENNLEYQKILVGFLLKNAPHGKVLAATVIAHLNSGNDEMKKKAIALADYIKTQKIKYFKSTNLVAFLIGIIIYGLASVLNFIPYSICKLIAKRTTHLNEFYDSVLFCSLLFLYPVYLLALFFAMLIISHSWVYGTILIMLTLVTAKLREWAKRNIHCFVHRKQMQAVSTMFNGLFEKGNG